MFVSLITDTMSYIIHTKNIPSAVATFLLGSVDKPSALGFLKHEKSLEQ
jgi:hypothetical protein